MCVRILNILGILFVMLDSLNIQLWYFNLTHYTHTHIHSSLTTLGSRNFDLARHDIPSSVMKHLYNRLSIAWIGAFRSDRQTFLARKFYI